MKNKIRILLSLFPVALIVIPLLLMPLVHASSMQNTEYIQPSTLATAPEVEWSRTYGGSAGDRGFSVQQTSDGGYIIAGKTASYGAGYSDVYLIKTDSFGIEAWSRTYGGSSEDQGQLVQQTSDGGYIIVGYTLSYGAGLSDVYLIKTDASGGEEWSRTYGGSQQDMGFSVQQTSDGGYIIVGHTFSLGAGSSDVYLIKTDASGVEQWSTTYGGSDGDEGRSVRQTADGGYIIAGRKSPVFCLIKTDASGGEEWSRTFDEASWGRGVQQTSDGGYIVAGISSSIGTGYSDVYLIKTDTAGVEEWNRTYGGSVQDMGFSVQQTSDGGYIIVGSIETSGTRDSDVYLIKTDASGVEQWSTTYGGSDWDEGRSVQQTADGGYIIGGATLSYGAGQSDVYLIKYGTTGPSPTLQDSKVKDWQITNEYEAFGGLYALLQYFLLGTSKVNDCNVDVLFDKYENIEKVELMFRSGGSIQLNNVGDGKWSRRVEGYTDLSPGDVQNIIGFILSIIGSTLKIHIGLPTNPNINCNYSLILDEITVTESSGKTYSFTQSESGKTLPNIFPTLCDALDSWKFLPIMPGGGGGAIIALSPVDLTVVDPDGLVINKENSESADALYFEEDVDNNGDTEDLIVISNWKTGDYQITVVPEPDALPTDTFSLMASFGETTTTLADNVPISDIPDEPYVFEAEEIEPTPTPGSSGSPSWIWPIVGVGCALLLLLAVIIYLRVVRKKPAVQAASEAEASQVTATSSDEVEDSAPVDVRCPICGSETVIRTAKKGKRVGSQFYVCTRYPECKGKIAVE